MMMMKQVKEKDGRLLRMKERGRRREERKTRRFTDQDNDFGLFRRPIRENERNRGKERGEVRGKNRGEREGGMIMMMRPCEMR